MTLSSVPCRRKTGTDGFGDFDGESAGAPPYALIVSSVYLTLPWFSQPGGLP